MRQIKLIYLESSRENWLGEVQKNYNKKINYFSKFSIESIKTKSLSRSHKADKIKQERELLLKRVTKNDFVIACDEKGKAFKSSRDFSTQLIKLLEEQPNDLIFIIGGSYGLDIRVKERANMLISLSHLTMSHLIAQAFILEQLYRAFTIHKNIPYHND